MSLQDDLRAEAMTAALGGLLRQLKRFTDTKPDRTVRSLNKTELLLAVDDAVCDWIACRERQRAKLKDLGILDPFALDAPPGDHAKMYAKAPGAPFDDPLPPALNAAADLLD